MDPLGPLVIVRECNGSRDGRKTGEFGGEAVLSCVEVGEEKLTLAIRLRFVRGGIRPTQEADGRAGNHTAVRISEIPGQTGRRHCGVHTGKTEHEGSTDESQESPKTRDLITSATHAAASCSELWPFTV